MKTVVALIALLTFGLAEAKTYSGHIYVGPENEAFYPCGNKAGFWFLTSEAVRDRLISEGFSKSKALSEQGVFVELDGNVGRKTKKSDEVAYEYPAFFHIERVISIRSVSPNDCLR